MKSKINFIIDILLFVNLCLMAGIGFLIEWTLIPGKKIPEVYDANVELYFWGLDRHGWGAVHLITAFVFLFLMLLHIVLHWKQIRTLYRKWIGNRAARSGAAVVFGLICAVLTFFAFLVRIDVVPFERGQGRHGEHRIEETVLDPGLRTEDQTGRAPDIRKYENAEAAGSGSIPEPESQIRQNAPSGKEDRPRRRVTAEEDQTRHTRDEDEHVVGIEIFGSMSIAEAASTYRVPVDSLKRFLGLPANTSPGERLGRLRRIYDFHMSDIEQYIDSYHKR